MTHSPAQKKKLDAAHHKFQRRLLGITWKDKVRRHTKSDETTKNGPHHQGKKIEMAGTCCAWKTAGYQSKPHDGKSTRAPEEPEGRDRTGLTPYLKI